MKSSRAALSHALFSKLLLYVTFLFYSTEGIKFQHSSFDTTSISDISIVELQVPWYKGQNAYLENLAFWLTPDPRDGNTSKYSNIGQILYKDPIQFMNTHSEYPPHQVASFTTSFTFSIITTGPYDSCGSGMAFFISSLDRPPLNSHGRYLGLLSPNATGITNFFAVEFDTHRTPDLQDPSGSHIGIDIDSLISVNYTDTSPNSSSPFYPELYLYSNFTFQAWIEYNSSTHLIQVWMTNSPSAQRPPRACLQFTYDLSNVFKEFMHVGFSATNKAGEDHMEGHVVYAWSFSSDEDFPEKPIHHKLIVPLAITLSTILTASTLGITLFLIKRQRRMTAARVPSTVHSRTENSIIQLGSNRYALPRYTYKELKRSTQGFSDQNKVGVGGFSSVYKGTLADGSMMAIKRLKEGVRREVEFNAELSIISSIRHRNLLPLRGWCYEKGEAMLVYKYMRNGSLDSYLYGKKRGTLQSETRLKILAGVASALEYLHGNLGECVLHRDVKAANVLLTEGFDPMLCDFGLARLIGHDEGAVTMTAVGTPGCVAPELIYTGRATDKADVYSFGVLMLETAFGRPAMDRSSVQPEEARLVDYAWMLHQRSHLEEGLDPSMFMCMDMTPLQKEQWRCVLHVALMCCNPWPGSRPTMRQISQALKGDSVLLMEALPATRPLYPICPDWPAASGSSTSLNAWSATISSEAGGPASTPSN